MPRSSVPRGAGRAAAAGVGGAVRGGARAHRPAGEGRPYRYRASAGELAPREEDWDAVEDHLGRRATRRRGWVERGELEGIYEEGFVEALDTEATRLLGAENSVTRRMADGRFPAEDLADARVLLSVPFRRYMQEKRERKREGRG